MTTTVDELRSIVKDFSVKLNQIADNDFSAKPPNKWSKKEILGHLIDSAQNNLRRFICGQYETIPSTITYNQDFWVTANAYQQANGNDVIELWRLINLRICDILQNMPQENYTKISNNGSNQTLQWLAEDYVRHLKHHLNQIFTGSFDLVYTS